MKKLFLTVAVTIASFTALQAQSAMFEKFNEYNDITVVSVKKALLSMAGNMMVGSTDVKSLSEKLDLIEIYSCENTKTIKMMKDEVKHATSSMELLMNIKEEGSVVVFYAMQDKNGSISDFLMVASEGDSEYSIIHLIGKFTADDLKKVTGM